MQTHTYNHERITQGLDLWQHIVVTQQQILREQGHIPQDDPRMWRDLLDLLDNEHYALLFEIMDRVHEVWHVTPHHERLISRARDYFESHCDRMPRAMDRNPSYKAPSWGFVMALREIWEDIVRAHT